MKATITKKSGITVNDMIYNTLITKGSKEPKYRNILEAFGYTLTNQHDWSDYDYWGIQCVDGSVLVISKTYGNERGLFKTARLIHTKNIKKVNFVGVIKSKRERFSPVSLIPTNLVSQYKYKKGIMETDKWLYDSARKDVEAIEKKLEKAKKHLDYCADNYSKTIEDFESFKSQYLKKGGD